LERNTETDGSTRTQSSDHCGKTEAEFTAKRQRFGEINAIAPVCQRSDEAAGSNAQSLNGC